MLQDDSKITPQGKTDIERVQTERTGYIKNIYEGEIYTQIPFGFSVGISLPLEVLDDEVVSSAVPLVC